MDSDSYDLVIRNATVVDGTGVARKRADVALRGDRIAAVGDPGFTGNGTVLDARGLVLAPGFIDVHTHDDFAVVLQPDMRCKVLQGVTTSIVGNCGFGAAPYASAALFAGAFHPGEALPVWEGYGGYLDRFEGEPSSLNVGALVGHGTLRHAAMGNERRAPTAGELDRMKGLLREGLEGGALGLSTGLIYEPGRHARTEEIVALAAQMAGTGALYASHMRDEADGLIESVRETIAIGERADVPVQISHHKAAGRTNWGRVQESLQLIEEAQARGIDVTADQYPYTSGSTILAAVMQNEALRTGGGGIGSLAPSEILIASAPQHPAWEGRTLEDLSEEFGTSPVQAAKRILDEEGPSATVILHVMDEKDVQTVLRHPSTMIGSDGLPTLKGKPHPRLYGTFARVLGRYARDLDLLSLEEAVHRMTGFPTRKFGIADRGVVRPGAYADLVLFDPEAIADVATYEDPHRPPLGIPHVFVNGVQLVRGGEHTGARPGRALRRT
jgi:N-acyl-D-amino-acid deacylase